MAIPLPPPQRKPSAREAALISALREYLNEEPPTTSEEWLDRIEGLRNLEVDASAIWEEAICRAKAAGVTWGQLHNSTGIHKASLQYRVKEQPAQALAARPRDGARRDADSSAA